MKKQVLLGTTNQAKINIVQAYIESLPVEILTLHELNIKTEIREDGRSTEENAEKKAKVYFAESHIPTLAIDGGLHIEKFPEKKQSGIFIRRIYGIDRDATDRRGDTGLFRKGVGQGWRGAYRHLEGVYCISDLEREGLL